MICDASLMKWCSSAFCSDVRDENGSIDRTHVAGEDKDDDGEGVDGDDDNDDDNDDDARDGDAVGDGRGDTGPDEALVTVACAPRRTAVPDDGAEAGVRVV